MPAEDAAQRRWMAQWRYAAVALEAHRRAALRRLTDDEARAAVEDLFRLVDELPDRSERLSGLIEQQRLLHARAT